MIAAIHFSNHRLVGCVADYPEVYNYLHPMSEEKISKLESDLEALSKLGGWIKALVIGGVMIGSWVGVMEFRQETTSTEILALQRQAQEFDRWKERQTGNLYTSVDHNKYAIETASQAATQDKRVTRLEDAIGVVKDELTWIKQNLREKDEKKP